MTGKLHMRVEKNFLTAMETDGFLKPLLIVEQPVRQNDGSTKIQPVHYYSPFQIYIVLQLSSNIINDEGKIESRDSKMMQNQQHVTRYISWGYGGAMSFNINNKKEQKGPSGWPSELMLCDHLYNFLRMLHTFDLTPRYSENWKPERTRYYTRQPDFQFNFNISKEDSKKLLKRFKLNVEKIETLRTIIGQTALIIDPLEKWYPFFKRLPQWRKDELKGEALLVQELYGFCEVIADFLEIVSGARPQELAEKVYSGFLLNDKHHEYARGTDIEAVRLAASKLKTWMTNKKNSNFVNEISGSEVMAGYSQQLKQVEKQLTDYEQRYKKYGAGRSVNSNGFLHTGIKNTGTITLDELDPQAKRMVQNFMEQLKTQDAIKNETVELQQEIRFAIRLRLDDIQRDLSNLIHNIIQPLDSRRWQLDSEKQRGQQYTWWGEYMMSGEAPVDPAQVRTYYMEKFQPKKTAEFDDKIKSLLGASHSLEGFMDLARLVLCAYCRKNTVLLHQTHNDRRVSSEAICDSCVKDKKRSPDNVRGGEWRCPNCDRVIYKFANGNVLSARTQTKFPVVIELKYGQLEIEAYCPDCKIYIPETIDWGWLS